jgi:hypothetical protein
MLEPYARDIIFTLHNKAGLRLFGLNRQVPDAIVANDIGRFNTLLRVNGIDLNSVPLGQDLIGSLAAAEQSSVEVELSNIDGWWSRIVALEPMFGAMGGLFVYYASGKLPLLYRGKVGRLRIRKRVTRIELREP